MSRTIDFDDGFESSSPATSSPLPASDVSNTPSGNLSSTNQQAVNNELQTDIDTRATSSALTSHESDTTLIHGIADTSLLATTTGAQALINKDIDGGTAANTRRLTLPKDTLTNLTSLTRKQGTLVFDTTSNKPYYDDGSNLRVIGSGSGAGGNLIDDGDAEAGTSNYVEGSYSAATRPAGTFTSSSGVGSFAISTNTSSSLFGNTSFLLTKSSGASIQGRAIERTISIPLGYRTKMLKTRIDYTIVSGSFVAGTNGSSPTDSSLIWYVGQYNGSIWSYTEPSTFKMFSSSTTNPDFIEGEFQVNSDTTQIKLIAYVAETANSAWVVKCEVGIKESLYVSGTTITNPVAYTPVITNFGNGVGYLNWERRGAKIAIQGTLVVGTTLPTGIIKFALPPGLTADYSTIPKGIANSDSFQRVGTGTTYASEYFTSLIVRDIASNNTFYFNGNNTTYGVSGDWSATVPVTFTAGDTLSVDLEVPILGWSASTQMSDGYDGRQIGFRANNSATVISATPAKIVWTNVDKDDVAGYLSGTYTVRSAGWYDVDASLYLSGTPVVDGTSTIDVYRNGVAVKSYVHRYKVASATSTSVSVGDSFYFNVGDTIEIYVSSDMTTPTILSSTTRNIFSVSKRQSSTTISATEIVSASYQTTAGQSFNATEAVANFGTVIHDTHGAVSNASTNFTFIAPYSGWYELNARQTGGATQANADCYSTIFFNGVAVGRDQHYVQSTNSVVQIRAYGYGWLNAGQTIQLKTRAGSAVSMSVSAIENFITIKKIK